VPNSTNDRGWFFSASGDFSKYTVEFPVEGDPVPFADDFDGDGLDDIFWYEAP